ncbi:Myb-like_DNA-binding domain-containing protein [Hexamita inflata]|uniref:Myb-like_DNA-binding domain-containing protein n=1 Tax=Hexamita inflata TaxID=28002 RepID=A0ABP1HEH9_9EUKA
MSNKEYKTWSEQDKKQLISAIEQAKRKCGQIDWDDVALNMSGRSRQQCKSYFMNILRKESNVDMVKYHTWTQLEVDTLMNCVQLENKNWDLIRQNYFPSLTNHQLQAKYSYTLQQQTKKQIQFRQMAKSQPKLQISVSHLTIPQLPTVSGSCGEFNSAQLVSQLQSLLSTVM